MEFFERTANPSDTALPFRRVRATDPRPSDVGLSPPTDQPGTWRLTSDDGKHFKWKREPTPRNDPGTSEVRAFLGSEAVGHKAKFVAADPKVFGTRMFVPEQVTFNKRPTPEPQRELPGVLGVNNISVRPDPMVPARLRQAVAPAQAAPEGILSQQSLGFPDPAFHPRAGQPVLRPGTSEFARKPTGILDQAEPGNPFDPRRERFKIDPDEGLIASIEPTARQGELELATLNTKTDWWVPEQVEAFKKLAPSVDWRKQRNSHGKLLPNGINQGAYRVSFEGNPDALYFTKTAERHGDVPVEVAAINAGSPLGAMTVGAHLDGPRTLVTPWVNGKEFAKAPKEARSVISKMSPEERDRQTIFEFLIADDDKHPHNYMVDIDNGKVAGIDYGHALHGDETTLQRNAFYNVLRRLQPDSTSLNKDVLSDMISKEAEIVASFKDAGATGRQITELESRFDMVGALVGMDAPTYKSLENMIR